MLGLTQFRIKRLFAYSTISHVGFILLALSINSVESIQSYIFYILQYSISNLNAFIILITVGYTLHLYITTEKEVKQELVDVDNSPIQLVSQIKGYFYVNPFIAISLSITLFSFVGVPPMMGFFAKQMILSAALDSGYVFMALIAILTSVIGAGYYLNLVKEIFFQKPNYEINPSVPLEQRPLLDSKINDTGLVGYLSPIGKQNDRLSETKVSFMLKDIKVNSSLSTTISIMTLMLILFIYIPGE